MALDNSVFRRPPAVPSYRLTINSEGLDRSGKTYLALSGPGPLGLIKLDRNSDNVTIPRQREGKVIYVADFTNPDPRTNPLAQFVIPPREKSGKPVAKDKAADKSFYEKRWDAISSAYYDLVNESSIRTVVVDTGSSLYEECRLSRFGKLTQIMPKEYGAINKELSEMVMACKCNLVMIHRLKKQYRNGDWDGKSYDGVGYNGVAYDAQVTLRHTCTLEKDADNPTVKKAHFVCSVTNCSQDAGLMGLELTGEDISFSVLGNLIYPDAPDGTWE